MLSKSLLNPEAQIFMLQEKKNLFLVGKNKLIVMAPVLINKDVFESSQNDLKFMVRNSNYIRTSLIQKGPWNKEISIIVGKATR